MTKTTVRHAKIIKEYKDGYLPKEILRRNGISQSTLYRVLRNHAVPTKERSELLNKCELCECVIPLKDKKCSWCNNHPPKMKKHCSVCGKSINSTQETHRVRGNICMSCSGAAARRTPYRF